MRIAVVGCGAVGSFYGARILRAGVHQVHFLLRSDYEVVRRNGVFIESVEGDFHVHPFCAAKPEEIGPSDVVIIALKTTANDQFRTLLTPLAGQDTVFITLQNGLGSDEQLAALFGPDNILGGLCFVCLNRIAPGHIRHIAHGRIVMGEFSRPVSTRTTAMADIFRQAGIKCDITDNLARARWEKLVWNVPFNGLGVAGAAGYEAVVTGHLPKGTIPGPCLPTDVLLADPKWFKLVCELMGEIIATANAQGFNIPSSWADENIQRTRLMGAYRASTLIDFEQGRPLELESMFLRPLQAAKDANVPTPRLAALCSVLQQLDASFKISPR
jgi:2-dehydropantoate 2-reductase